MYLVAKRNTNLSFYNSRGQKSVTGLTGKNSRCWQGHKPSDIDTKLCKYLRIPVVIFRSKGCRHVLRMVLWKDFCVQQMCTTLQLWPERMLPFFQSLPIQVEMLKLLFFSSQWCCHLYTLFTSNLYFFLWNCLLMSFAYCSNTVGHFCQCIWKLSLKLLNFSFHLS